MITGTLQFVDIETGVWQLVTADQTYMLVFNQPPRDLKALIGKKVNVKGKVRSEVMGIGMAGMVLEVTSLSP